MRLTRLKKSLILSWVRLGVPLEIARYIVNMDTNGKTVVRTPLAKKVWERSKYDGFMDIVDQLEISRGDGEEDKFPPSYFKAERGTGQGDVGSPNNWKAFFDILLCAVSMAENGKFYTRGKDSEINEIKDPAYADDLNSFSSSLEGLQEKADIVSAFCIVMGIDLSPKKLRAFMRIWGGESEEQDNMELVVHLAGWSPHIIKLDSEQSQKSLGVVHDTHTSSINQLNAMEQTLEHYLGVILKRKGSIEMKKMVVETSLNKNTIYGKVLHTIDQRVSNTRCPIQQILQETI